MCLLEWSMQCFLECHFFIINETWRFYCIIRNMALFLHFYHSQLGFPDSVAVPFSDQPASFQCHSMPPTPGPWIWFANTAPVLFPYVFMCLVDHGFILAYRFLMTRSYDQLSSFGYLLSILSLILSLESSREVKSCHQMTVAIQSIVFIGIIIDDLVLGWSSHTWRYWLAAAVVHATRTWFLLGPYYLYGRLPPPWGHGRTTSHGDRSWKN